MTDTFLLTWNPALWPLENETWDEYIDATSAGEWPETRWSTGSRATGMGQGSRVFLLRQGDEPRGIVASGWVHHDEDIFQNTHWDGIPGRLANYIEFVYDHVIDPDDPLPLDVLKREVPGVGWEPRGGGVRVPAEAAAGIEELWEQHVGLHARPPASLDQAATRQAKGQAWQQDSAKRRLVEDYAQAWLEDEYRSSGWTVTDVRHKSPFDALAVKGREVRYLEAKGTQGAGESVLITSGELAHARTHPGQCVLGIVSGITFTSDGEIDESRTELTIYESWDPEAGTLRALQYQWAP